MSPRCVALVALALGVLAGGCSRAPSAPTAPSRRSTTAEVEAKLPAAKLPEAKLPEAKLPEAKLPEAKLPETVAPPPLRLGVPAYFFPGPLWNVLLDRADLGVVVFNPASGPGSAPLPEYVPHIREAEARGVLVLGYVPTGYGTGGRVAEDIRAYEALYGIRNIFFDETPTDCDTLHRVYQPWLSLVQSTGGRAAANPGAPPEACWADAADIVVTFEGPMVAFQAHLPPDYVPRYPPAKFWNIVHTTRLDELVEVRARAVANGVGLIFVTDDVAPNPFDQLPSWYQRTDVVAAPPAGVLPSLPPPTFAVPVGGN